MTLREIARAAGLGHTTITNIARRTTTRIWPHTLARILAASPQDWAEPFERGGPLQMNDTDRSIDGMQQLSIAATREATSNAAPNRRR